MPRVRPPRSPASWAQTGLGPAAPAISAWQQAWAGAAVGGYLLLLWLPIAGLAGATLGISLSVLVATVGMASDLSSGATHGAALISAVASPLLLVPNDLLLLAIASPLLAPLALASAGRRRWPDRALLVLIIALIGAAIVVVQSRSALLALVLALGVLLWRLRPQWSWRRLAGGALALLVALLAVDAALGFALSSKFGALCFSRGPFWSAAWHPIDR